MYTGNMENTVLRYKMWDVDRSLYFEGQHLIFHRHQDPTMKEGWDWRRVISKCEKCGEHPPPSVIAFKDFMEKM